MSEFFPCECGCYRHNHALFEPRTIKEVLKCLVGVISFNANLCYSNCENNCTCQQYKPRVLAKLGSEFMTFDEYWSNKRKVQKQ